MIVNDNGRFINKYYEIRNDGRYRNIPTETFDTYEEAIDRANELIENKALIYGADFNIKIYCISQEMVAKFNSSIRQMDEYNMD